MSECVDSALDMLEDIEKLSELDQKQVILSYLKAPSDFILSSSDALKALFSDKSVAPIIIEINRFTKLVEDRKKEPGSNKDKFQAYEFYLEDAIDEARANIFVLALNDYCACIPKE